MKFLRLILVLYGLFCLFGAVGLFLSQKGIGFLALGVYLLINATVIFAGALFEKRYKSNGALKVGFKPTGERFINPENGKTVEVHFNPKTGDRNYIDIETTPKKRS